MSTTLHTSLSAPAPLKHVMTDAEKVSFYDRNSPLTLAKWEASKKFSSDLCDMVQPKDKATFRSHAASAFSRTNKLPLPEEYAALAPEKFNWDTGMCNLFNLRSKSGFAHVNHPLAGGPIDVELTFLRRLVKFSGELLQGKVPDMNAMFPPAKPTVAPEKAPSLLSAEKTGPKTVEVGNILSGFSGHEM